MHKFVRSLVTEWRRLGLPTEDAAVVVAVSGGADSASLLAAMHELVDLEKLKLRLVAAHFNHGLRGAAGDEDEGFVRDLTNRFRLEFASGHGRVPTGGNLEQNARQARYSFLRRTAENIGAFAVLTGHTMNDQAETLLMNLIRGSGPAGLSGMKTVDQFGQRGVAEAKERRTGNTPTLPLERSLLLVRPLLSWAMRGDTELYCRDAGIEYRYDTMNDDTAFRRVRIRKVLLPLLQDMNPNIIETLANTAALLQSSTPHDIPRFPVSDDGTLYLSQLRPLSDGELAELLRSWLEQRIGTRRRLGSKHILAAVRLVKSTKSGRLVELPGGGRIIRSAGKLRYAEKGQ